METENQAPLIVPEQPENDPRTDQDQTDESNGEQLLEELGRLGRKFLEVVEVAWSSDQRREIEQDLRTGLNTVVESLEAGLQDIGEQEQTQEFVGKAEELADTVTEKVRSSEFANQLAVGLASGLHALGDQLERLARELQAEQPAPDEQPTPSESGQASQDQDIPITAEPPESDA